MNKNFLGNTGMQVSIIGFGGIPIQRISQEDATKLVLEAKIRMKFNLYTARAYTVSEEYIGNALKEAGRENFYNSI